MPVVTVQLDDDLAAILAGAADDPAALARETLVLELYRRHAISAGRAAAALAIDRDSFARLAGGRGIPTIDMTADEWAAELGRIAGR